MVPSLTWVQAKDSGVVHSKVGLESHSFRRLGATEDLMVTGYSHASLADEAMVSGFAPTTWPGASQGTQTKSDETKLWHTHKDPPNVVTSRDQSKPT